MKKLMKKLMDVWSWIRGLFVLRPRDTTLTWDYEFLAGLEGRGELKKFVSTALAETILAQSEIQLTKKTSLAATEQGNTLYLWKAKVTYKYQGHV
jgi:hypothetical protein